MRALLAAAAAAVVTLTGCGGGGVPAPTTTTVSTSASAAVHRAVPSAVETAPAGSSSVATIRAGIKSITALDGPSAGGHPIKIIPAVNRYGSPATFLVVGGSRDWLKVTLPSRPNGSTGWVRVADVTVTTTTSRIDVDLRARKVTVTVDGKTTTGPVAIGSTKNPTPTGRFFVTDRVRPPARSAYGTFALGLSAHSDTLSEFGGGDGQIGIHGTDKAGAASIGQAVSHGCIRVDDKVALVLPQVALGAVVVIH